MPHFVTASMRRSIWTRWLFYAVLLLAVVTLVWKSLGSPIQVPLITTLHQFYHGTNLVIDEGIGSSGTGFQDGQTVLKTDSVALILKTGYDVYSARLPAQLETFASRKYDRSPANTIIIADFDTTIKYTDWHVQDVLASFNWTDELKSNDRYRIYSNQAAAIAAYEPRSGAYVAPGTNNDGWQLDAMKFIPGYKLAAETFQAAEWTIGVDDDTYVLWDNLMAFLSLLDHTKPLYIGSPAVMPPSEIVFAHGGSVVITSQAAMKQRFIDNTTSLAQWERESLNWCCGDGKNITEVVRSNWTNNG